MDYDEVLAQVLALLRREQRLSYRILKRRFQLTDDDLEDLWEDIIYAKKLGRDEEGRVLVWTGDASPPLEPLRPRRLPSLLRGPRRGQLPLLCRLPQTPSVGSSRCCSVTWLTPLALPVSSIRKTCARSSGPIRPPVSE